MHQGIIQISIQSKIVVSEMEYSDRIALLWSVNPQGKYSEQHQFVGSVLAHQAHIERYGAVYWDLLTEAELSQFAGSFPMSGYLYCTDTKSVNYRVRIREMTWGTKKKNKAYIPDWRKYDYPDNTLFILLDQIDLLFPSRSYKDFVKIVDEEPVKRPPIGNYIRVFDPLY